ncbi:hypothetical protein N9V97_00870 [Luminiphilus sp.]|nr:hypothetical protein [Luminiphilus sp.]
MNKLTVLFSAVAIIAASVSLVVSVSTASEIDGKTDEDWEVKYLRCSAEANGYPFTVQIHEHYIQWDRVAMTYSIADLLLTANDGARRRIYVDQISGEWSDSENYTGTCKKVEPLF